MNDKIRILLIIGKLKIGGAERIGRDIGFYANKEIYEISYLVFGNEIGSYEKELTSCGCRIYHLAPPSEGYFKYCRELNSLIKKNRFTVIHSHTMFSSGWAMLIGYIQTVPVRIVHSHTIKGPEKRGLLKNTYEYIMRLMIRKFGTDFVACGDSAGKWCFGEKFYHKHGKRIYNGIDLKDYFFDIAARKEIRKEFGLEESDFIIGHVGHLAPVKNQKLLIRIMPDILKRIEDAKLFLLGDGEDKVSLKSLIDNMGLANHIVMTGNVSNVGQFMSAMDVFVFPSLYEGMPLSLVEAQTNGLPCCISDKIPKDVYLTNLIHVLSIDNNDQQWVDTICQMQRSDPEKYAEIMMKKGFDTKDMLKKIYSLYEGKKQ